MEQALLVLAKNSSEESSLGKLLELHSSVYNALTNPDLDVNIPTLPPLDTYSPGPMDLRLTSSFLLWQNLHLPDSVARLLFAARSTGASPNSVNRPLSSILSSEEDESLVLVPLAKGSVMVFETDEESEGEDLPEMPHKYGSCPLAAFGDDTSTLTANDEHAGKKVGLPLHLSFIMPKISLSDTQSRYRVTVVTSASSSMKIESSQLIEFFQNSFGSVMQRIQITHLVVSNTPLKLDLSLLKSSNLVFVVNDGTMTIPQVLLSAALSTDHTDLPKLTIINIITTNYFINLVDMISAWRPFQIWKSPSLGSEPFRLRIKSFVEDELLDTSGGRYAEEFEAKKRKFQRSKSPPLGSDDVTDADALNASNSMYDSLVRPRKPDYKGIERQIRSELQMSQSFSNTDPLRLSSDLHNFAHMYRIAKTLLGLQATSPSDSELQLQRMGGLRNVISWIWSLVPTRNVWLICSFSMGLGVGVTVASGAATMFAVYFFESARAYSSVACEKVVARLTSSQMQENVVSDISSRSLDKIAEVSNVITDNIVSWSHDVVDATMNLTNTKFFTDMLAWLNTHVQNVKSLSSFALMAAHNGLEKTIKLFSSVSNVMP